jgi:thiol-disulfide isomerase/thioredoxin
MTADASTPKTAIVAGNAENRFSLGLCAAALLLASVLVTPAAGAAPAACSPAKDVFANFLAKDPLTPVPDIAILEKSGNETSLQAYQGRGVVLNFWATWCAPCVREMPQLNRLSAFVKDNRIDVLTLSEDREGLEAAPKFYKTHNLNDLPVLADPNGKLMRAFAVTGLPTTIFIDSGGMELGRVIGPAEWDSPDIVDFVRSCLAPPA